MEDTHTLLDLEFYACHCGPMKWVRCDGHSEVSYDTKYTNVVLFEINLYSYICISSENSRDVSDFVEYSKTRKCLSLYDIIHRFEDVR